MEALAEAMTRLLTDQALMRAAQGLEGHGRLILRSPGDLVRRILSLIPMDKLANVEVVDDEET